MRNNFIDTFKSFKSSFVGVNIKPCFCYCRTWFHEGVHNGRFLILWTDEVEYFKGIKGNDFDVIATRNEK